MIIFTKQPFDYNLRIHINPIFRREISWSFENGSKLTAQQILTLFGKPDVIWASPDCTTFSVAAISYHRRKNPITGNLEPITDYAKFCDVTDQHVVDLIKELNPTFYFIENPRGGMRKMSFVQDLPRYTVTYCQYGEERMKPTDIWTNHPNPRFIPPLVGMVINVMLQLREAQERGHKALKTQRTDQEYPNCYVNIS